MEWQRRVVEPWVAVDDDGLWAATTCGLSVPRQNGKTLGTIAARVVYGMLARNEMIVYTSHAQTTSTETFEGIRDIFESRRLKRYVKAVRSALGREAIFLKSGARIKFFARTRNGGRGKHGDLLIFDEAQELTDVQQASFQPSISASENPQTIYLGTPPDENAPGEVFRRIRDKALDGEPRRAWAEWSVDEVGDVSDRVRWYATNPSLGSLILESSVEAECGNFAPDKFARDRLGWWSNTAEQLEHPISRDDWAACQTDEPPADGIMGVGAKFSPDGKRISLAVCLRPALGSPYIEVVASKSTQRGTRWLSDWLLKRKRKIASVAIDGRRGERVVQNLRDGGFVKRAIHKTTSGDVARACSMLVDAVDSHEIEHYGQPDLDEAATTCVRRSIGKDGFGFDDTDTGDSTLIEACALAYLEAMTTKRRPGRKAVVI